METEPTQNIEKILENLIKHENRLNTFINMFEKTMGTEINPQELRQYGAISIHDKRNPHWTNYGQIIMRKMGVNGLELTTDRGYTLCLSGNCAKYDPAPAPELT